MMVSLEDVLETIATRRRIAEVEPSEPVDRRRSLLREHRRRELEILERLADELVQENERWVRERDAVEA